MRTTTSASRAISPVSRLGKAFVTSRPISAMAATTEGLISAAGAVPAERTRTRPPARWSSRAAAIWLRPALWTQTNRTSGRSPIGLTAQTLTTRDGEKPPRSRTLDERLRGPHDGREDPVGHLVRRREPHVHESRPMQVGLVLLERQGAGDAANPAPALRSVCRRQVVAGR